MMRRFCHSYIHFKMISCLGDNLHRHILPFFKFNTLVDSDLSISSACARIKKYSLLFLSNMNHSQSVQSDLENQIVFYFDAISRGTLYSHSYQDEIHPLLIYIATCLPDTDTFDHSDSQAIDILNLFLSSLQNRTCLDQHRDSLRKVMIYPIIKLFDPPIQGIIEYFYHRMEQQIHLTLLSWNASVFNGFVDKEVVHSKHIVLLVLDDLFRIAGGCFLNEKDILLSKTPLAKFICYAAFKDTLTLSGLFSDSGLDWDECLAKQLSSGEDSLPSSFKLSLLDLCNSPKLLNFLIKNGVLTPPQIKYLKDVSSPSSNISVSFQLPFLSYSDSSTIPFLNFNKLFVTLLIKHIQHTLSVQNFTRGNLCLSPKLPLIDKAILDNLVNGYFLAYQDRRPFSLDEIKHAHQHLNSSPLYSLPFLKPHLNLTTMMTAFCSSQDVSEVFSSFILPNRSHPWSLDCLCLMLASNPDFISDIPSDQILSFTDSDGNTIFHLFSMHSPDNLVNLTQHLSNPASSLVFPDSNGLTPLHYLAKYSGASLLKLMDSFDITLDMLTVGCFRYSTTALHWLSQHNPSILVNLLNKGVISLSNLIECKTSYDSSVIHWFMKYNPDTLFDLLKDFSVPFQSICDHHDKFGLSPLFWFCTTYPSRIFDLLNSGVLTCFDLSSDSDPSGNSVLHHFATSFPDILFQLFSRGFLSREHILHSKNHKGESFIYFLTKEHPKVLFDLIKGKFIDADLLTILKTDSCVTPLHLLAAYHENILAMCLIYNFITDRSLVSIFNNDDVCPFDILKQYKHMYILEGIIPLHKRLSLQASLVCHDLKRNYFYKMFLFVFFLAFSFNFLSHYTKV